MPVRQTVMTTLARACSTSTYRIASAASPLYALLPLAVLGLPAPAPILVLCLFTAVLIWIRHHENIGRLLKGTESRIGSKTK